VSERAQEVFLQLVELGGEERAAALRDACGDDDDLRREVTGMLALVDDDAVAFLDDDVVRERELPMPERIGRYRVVRTIGEGTSGTVFEGEQSNPKRRVAVKMLRTLCATPREAAAFSFEAEILGRLDHPGIAKVYECGILRGATASQPFIAMEYVQGQGLDAFLREHRRLDERDAIGKIMKVCAAVEHAHRHGVIHRDLKPANVLITPAGHVKLVDFGIARLSERAELTTTMPTFAGLAGTLPYMSPELVDADETGVDARTDVYSLGVMLFELLTGRQPIELAGRSLADSLRAIVHESPPPLRSLRRSLGADLETIVACAMAKDPADRYRSAQDLREDLQRYRDHKPIAARPPSVLYVASKLVRRNFAMVAISALAVLALIGGSIGTWVYAVQSNERAAESERRLHLARGSLDMLFDEVIETLPRYAGTADLLERILEQGTGYYSRLAEEAPGDLDERRKIWLALERLAVTRMRLGNGDGARVAARRFHEMVEQARLAGPGSDVDFDLLRAEWLLQHLGDTTRAATVEALSRELERTRSDDPDVLVYIGGMLTTTQKGTESDEFRRAEQLCQRALQLAPTNLKALNLRCVLDDHLGNLLVSRHQYEAARGVQQQLVERESEMLESRATDPALLNNLVVSRCKLAGTLEKLGDVVTARGVAERALSDARELTSLEPNSRTVRFTMGSILHQAATLAPPGPSREACALLLESCETHLDYGHNHHHSDMAARSVALAAERAASPEQAAEVEACYERLRRAVAESPAFQEGIICACGREEVRAYGTEARRRLCELAADVTRICRDDEIVAEAHAHIAELQPR